MFTEEITRKKWIYANKIAAMAFGIHFQGQPLNHRAELADAALGIGTVLGWDVYWLVISNTNWMGVEVGIA